MRVCNYGNCNKSYKNKPDLLKHVCTIINEEQHRDQCTYKTTLKRLFQCHQLSHEDRFPYKCLSCNYVCKYRNQTRKSSCVKARSIPTIGVSSTPSVTRSDGGREVPKVGYPLSGVPPGLMGYPRWGTPWQGYPPARSDGGNLRCSTPPPARVPPSWTWLWYPPLAGPGRGALPQVPPHPLHLRPPQTWPGGYPCRGDTPPWVTDGVLYTPMVGMPLAFTQEDFLVCVKNSIFLFFIFSVFFS